MAKPVKHECVFWPGTPIEKCFVNVYRTSHGTTYSAPWSDRYSAQNFPKRAASYRLHIKPKASAK